MKVSYRLIAGVLACLLAAPVVAQLVPCTRSCRVLVPGQDGIATGPFTGCRTYSDYYGVLTQNPEGLEGGVLPYEGVRIIQTSWVTCEPVCIPTTTGSQLSFNFAGAGAQSEVRHTFCCPFIPGS